MLQFFFFLMENISHFLVLGRTENKQKLTEKFNNWSTENQPFSVENVFCFLSALAEIIFRTEQSMGTQIFLSTETCIFLFSLFSHVSCSHLCSQWQTHCSTLSVTPEQKHNKKLANCCVFVLICAFFVRIWEFSLLS